MTDVNRWLPDEHDFLGDLGITIEARQRTPSLLRGRQVTRDRVLKRSDERVRSLASGAVSRLSPTVPVPACRTAR